MDAPINYTEPHDIQMLRDTIRRFVDDHMPREQARLWDRENIFPRDVFKELAKLGMMGLTVSEQYGGSGPNIYAAMVVIEELAKRSVAVACPYIQAVCYAGMNLGEKANDEQKAALLPKVASGDLIFAYGLSEPNVGGDLAAVETVGVVDGDHIVINGTKRWCTGAHIADYIFCLLRTGPKDERYNNLSIVLIPTDTKGISHQPLGHLGIRGVATMDAMFDDVRVPLSNILGGPDMLNKGWSQLAGRALEVEKLELSACALGLAEAAVQDAWTYAEEREQFGKPISAHQAIRHDLAEVKTRVAAMRHMLYHAAWLTDQGHNSTVETCMAKLFCCEGAAEVTQKCQRITGAYGLSDGMDMERYVRDAISLPIVGGSSNMQKNNISNRLGLRAK